MLIRVFILSASLMSSAVVSVAAQSTQDAEPVLRLRLQSPMVAEQNRLLLRPRFNADDARRAIANTVPQVRTDEGSRVGKFAYVSTPHPNLVIAVGAADDPSEMGRQIDRAIVGMASASELYATARDTAPFVGLGVQSGNSHRGWSMDASIGAHLLNQAEQARTFDTIAMPYREGIEAEARANLRLRYKF